MTATIAVETLVVSHPNADFDAFAGMLAAQLLYPGARICLHGGVNRNARPADLLPPCFAARFGGADLTRLRITSDPSRHLPKTRPKEPSMREIFRPAACALSVACLALAMSAVSSGEVMAQAKQAPPKQSAPAQAAPPPAVEAPALKQIALTEKQIEGVRAAQKDVDAITAKSPDNAKPDPKIDAQLDAVAKKNGFTGYDDYNTVIDNISLVLGGFDPATKKYVGAETVLKAQIAQVQADKKMPAKDKKAALADLNEALKSPPPAIENKGNIDLVAKYYDKLAEVLGEGEE